MLEVCKASWTLLSRRSPRIRLLQGKTKSSRSPPFHKITEKSVKGRLMSLQKPLEKSELRISPSKSSNRETKKHNQQRMAVTREMAIADKRTATLTLLTKKLKCNQKEKEEEGKMNTDLQKILKIAMKTNRTRKAKETKVKGIRKDK